MKRSIILFVLLTATIFAQEEKKQVIIPTTNGQTIIANDEQASLWEDYQTTQEQIKKLKLEIAEREELIKKNIAILDYLNSKIMQIEKSKPKKE